MRRRLRFLAQANLPTPILGGANVVALRWSGDGKRSMIKGPDAARASLGPTNSQNGHLTTWHRFVFLLVASCTRPNKVFVRQRQPRSRPVPNDRRPTSAIIPNNMVDTSRPLRRDVGMPPPDAPNTRSHTNDNDLNSRRPYTSEPMDGEGFGKPVR